MDGLVDLNGGPKTEEPNSSPYGFPENEQIAVRTLFLFEQNRITADLSAVVLWMR
jgi:hypothetical protein